MDHYRTVAELVRVINNMLNSDDQFIVQHAETLLGPRKRGSTTELALDHPSVINERVVETTDKYKDVLLPGSRCFSFYSTAIKGKMEAITLEDAINNDLSVKVRKGDHGLELVLDESINSLCFSFNKLLQDIYGFAGVEEEIHDLEICIITSVYNGQEVVATWHPGPPMRPLQSDIAVKLR